MIDLLPSLNRSALRAIAQTLTETVATQAPSEAEPYPVRASMERILANADLEPLHESFRLQVLRREEFQGELSRRRDALLAQSLTPDHPELDGVIAHFAESEREREPSPGDMRFYQALYDAGAAILAHVKETHEIDIRRILERAIENNLPPNAPVLLEGEDPAKRMETVWRRDIDLTLEKGTHYTHFAQHLKTLYFAARDYGLDTALGQAANDSFEYGLIAFLEGRSSQVRGPAEGLLRNLGHNDLYNPYVEGKQPEIPLAELWELWSPAFGGDVSQVDAPTGMQHAHRWVSELVRDAPAFGAHVATLRAWRPPILEYPPPDPNPDFLNASEWRGALNENVEAWKEYVARFAAEQGIEFDTELLRYVGLREGVEEKSRATNR